MMNESQSTVAKRRIIDDAINNCKNVISATRSQNKDRKGSHDFKLDTVSIWQAYGKYCEDIDILYLDLKLLTPKQYDKWSNLVPDDHQVLKYLKKLRAKC